MFESAGPPTGSELVSVWLAIGMVFALLAGAGAGILCWLNDKKIPAAILKGTAFVATLTLTILIISLFSG